MQGVLIDDSVDIFDFTGAFPVAIANAAGLQVLVAFFEAYFSGGIEAAAAFGNFDAIGQQDPAVEANLDVAFGDIAAQGRVVTLLVCFDDREGFRWLWLDWLGLWADCFYRRAWAWIVATAWDD